MGSLDDSNRAVTLMLGGGLHPNPSPSSLSNFCSAMNESVNGRISWASSSAGEESFSDSRDLHVKLSIKSFRVPELTIEIPETETVAFLKRTVTEAVTAMLAKDFMHLTTYSDQAASDASLDPPVIRLGNLVEGGHTSKVNMAEFSLLFEEELRLTCSSENLANMKKRGREDTESNLANMAKCLMLLSKGNITNDSIITQSESLLSRLFECKTCNRKFPSFQALGGHRASHMKSFQALGGYRASHRKSRLMGGDGDMLTAHNELVSKPKTHDCR
ncbi:hypothetical protein GIB67_017645 [Kingdonia uniflora]|uniref:C2H2-type domain-containing protein n=1 Tax=Kingdonia uniflora TaxID=39325 RepID=A0A7J7P3M0_9MAGN|nr:hypothetical protein GIB67_017645 [Kingdonia uniflora]